MNWDFFISHASEDKAEVARPLADMLKSRGFKVWYDEYTLTLGDNLRRSIEEGLASSRYGVVVLSPDFFAKKWTQLELDGLFALERQGEKRILPVWHGISASDVERFSSFMAMRLGVPTSTGLENVVHKIMEAARPTTGVELPKNASTASAKLHPHSIEILLVAQASDGRIMSSRHMGGLSVWSGGKIMGEVGNARAEALNLYSLDELLQAGLLQRKSESLLVLTQEGYDYHIPSGVIDAPEPRFPKVSESNFPYVKELLQAAVGGDGRILSVGHLGGHVLRAGSWSRDSGGDRRLEARWESALRELVNLGLLLSMSNSMYLVSHLGFLWTDDLKVQESNHAKPVDARTTLLPPRE